MGRSNRGWARLSASRVGGAVDQKVGGAVRQEGGPSGRPGERPGTWAALVHLGGSQERGCWHRSNYLQTCRGARTGAAKQFHFIWMAPLPTSTREGASWVPMGSRLACQQVLTKSGSLKPRRCGV